jgi:two-component system chemotaxis response regulator CheB
VLIERYRPSVITLDLAMPGIDGMSFLDELAAIPHAPVLVVSSHTPDDSDMAHQAIARGAAACFDKAHLVSHAKDFRRALKKSAQAKPVKATDHPAPPSRDSGPA